MREIIKESAKETFKGGLVIQKKSMSNYVVGKANNSK